MAAYEKGCSNGQGSSQACSSAGFIYLQKGLDGSIPEFAADYFRYSCEAKLSIGRACFELAKLQQQNIIKSANAESIAELYQRGCRLSDKE